MNGDQTREPVLDALTDPAEREVLRALTARLAADGERAGVLDVGYRVLDSPVGPLLLAATDRGLVRVAFAVEGHDRVLASLAERVGSRILRAPARTDGAARELDEYFARGRRDFDVPLDLRLAAGYRRQVLEALRQIGFGHTASYAEVASRTTSPRAVRAVGTACATNPLPLVVPCHRVVRSDGTPGRYVGGEPVKRLLLDLERDAR